MTTSYPTALDAFTNPTSSDQMNSATVPHATQHANLNDAVEALEAKVGITNSTDSSSLDYRIRGSDAVQGLYTRTLALMRVKAADPSVSGRVWGVILTSGNIGLSDDGGATVTSKTANPDSDGYAIQGMYFSTTYAWLLTGGQGSAQGKLFRSPLPDSSGNGLSWTAKFDLATQPGGANSTFRNSCVAISEPNVYLLEYGNGTVTGGPSFYQSGDSGATWTNRKTWADAKHGHAVQVISGVPWVALGDMGAAYTDIGMWCAAQAAGSTWGRRSIYGYDAGGTYLDTINFRTVSIGGNSMIVAESDNHYGHGPILYPSVSISSAMSFIPLCQLPAPYIGTMRQLTLTSEGNLMWVSTGESGSIGPVDSIWISKSPFTTAVLLESVALNTLSTLGDGVESGSYVFFGNYRITKEKFLGQ